MTTITSLSRTKMSQRIMEALNSNVEPPFSAIIFDCDGVLIDSSRSYDLALEQSTKTFGSLLGFNVPDISRSIGLLRKLGTFNNDWDALTVLMGFIYSKSKQKDLLKDIAAISSLQKRIRELESATLTIRVEELEILDLFELEQLLENTQKGAEYDFLVQSLIKDECIRAQFYSVVSYPGQVGESLLATLFDEIMYGEKVFKSTYGFECASSVLSKPGLIANERTIVQTSTLDLLSTFCAGNLGIITGRPKIPTIFTLAKLFDSYFTKPSICEFTGDYMLNEEESKPSPKAMLRVASFLRDRKTPILYAGDSGEDLLFVKRANETGLLGNQKIFFCAVAASGEKAKYFAIEGRSESVDIIIADINELPAVLSSAMRNRDH